MMQPFKKVIIKTYPNKWKKKPNHPDTKGTVECETVEGDTLTYDYAQWKPREGKKQTLTIWTLKEEDQDMVDDADNNEKEDTHQERTRTKPKASKEKDHRETAATPEIKDDLGDEW